MFAKKAKMHFMDIDGDWNSLGVIMRRDELLVVVRSNTSGTAPTLKEFRFPTHLIGLVKDAPTQTFAGQPAGTQALAVFKASVSGGGLLIAEFGKQSAFDRSTSESRHMPITVY